MIFSFMLIVRITPSRVHGISDATQGMICLSGLTANGYIVRRRVLLSIVASDWSFWTIVAQGGAPRVQDPLLTLSATGVVDLFVHALARTSAKLARRNTAIELIGGCAIVRRCAVDSAASGYVMALCTGTQIV